MKRAAWSLLVLIVLAALAAPWLAPNPPNRRFDDLLYAPPTPVHIFSDGLHAPFINPLRLVSRLERRFEADAATQVSLRWFTAGTLVTADPDADAPLLFLGADGYGRDIFSRLLYGARATLAVSLVSALLTTILEPASVAWLRTSVDGSTACCPACRSSSSFSRRFTSRLFCVRCSLWCCHHRRSSCC